MSIEVQGVGASQLAVFDQLITTFLQDSTVPAMALAVAKGGNLLLSKSYTDTSKASDPVNLQNSPFRCASTSKMITRIAIDQLIEQSRMSGGTFDFGSHVAPLLTLPAVPNTPTIGVQWPNVTVSALLNMQCRLYPEINTFDKFACTAFGHSLPVRDKLEMISYLLTQTDTLLPSTVPTPTYSNTAYLILSALVEAISGQDYPSYVKDHILTPLGLTRPHIGSSTFAGRAPYEFAYHGSGTNPNVMSESPSTVQKGDGDTNFAIIDGLGGWVMTAADFAKILSAFTTGGPGPLFSTAAFVADLFDSSKPGSWNFSQWPAGSGTVSYDWGGILPGVRSYASLRPSDGVVIVCSYNTDEAQSGDPPIPGIWNPRLLVAMHKAADESATWPEVHYDWFPTVAIPSFKAGGDWGGSTNYGTAAPGWHGWYPLGGSLTDTSPSAVIVHPGFYDVYAIAAGDRLWQKWWDGAAWQPYITTDSGWELHDDGAFRARQVSALSLSDKLRDVYLVGEDQAVYQKWWYDGTWHGPHRIGGQVDGVCAVAPTRDTRDLYANVSGSLYQCWWDGSNWSDWIPHNDGFVMVGAPAVVANGPDFRVVYAVRADGHVCHKNYSAPNWSPWFDIGMPDSGPVKGSPAVVMVQPSVYDVYVRGSDDRLYQKWWDSSGWHPDPGWVLHDDAGFRLASAPSVITESPTHRGVFATGHDGCLYYKFWQG